MAYRAKLDPNVFAAASDSLEKKFGHGPGEDAPAMATFSGTPGRFAGDIFKQGGMSSEFATAVKDNPDYFYGDTGYMKRLALLESTKIANWNIGGPAPDSQAA